MKQISPASACLALALSAACTPSQTLITPAPALGAPIQGITVEGFGDASGQPNLARVNVGVEARAATADAAITEANARMAQVMNALKQLGIQTQDLRTTSLALHFERYAEPPPRPLEEAPPPKGKPGAPTTAPVQPPAPKQEGVYRAQNMVEIKIRQLDQAGRVLSAATSAGANQLFGIQFDIEDTKPLEQEARTKAFADAKKKAESLAQLAGVKLGPPLSISEGARGGPVMPMGGQVMMRAEAADVPVERGELTVTTTVSVVFGLAQ
jgi:uncharacterized protein